MTFEFNRWGMFANLVTGKHGYFYCFGGIRAEANTLQDAKIEWARRYAENVRSRHPEMQVRRIAK